MDSSEYEEWLLAMWLWGFASGVRQVRIELRKVLSELQEALELQRMKERNVGKSSSAKARSPAASRRPGAEVREVLLSNRSNRLASLGKIIR